jgi:serine/threonine protein kinase
VNLNTDVRTWVAAQISGALAVLHQQGIVVGDLAPSNLLVGLRRDVEVCFVDCDSMVFRGRRALGAVETGDWNVPEGEPSDTHAADDYKLGLVILRLYSRTHDARAAEPHLRHLPAPVRPLLLRALGPVPAGRPPAGEWQRALAGLAAAGGLSERYPGPARRPLAPPPRRPPPRRPAPAQAPAFHASGRRSASPMLWLALVLVLILLMTRLLAALADQQGWGASGPAPQQPLHYYVVPGQP